MPPVPKPKHKRRTPKRARRGEFTAAVRDIIRERDGGLCVRCKKPAVQIHHIIFRSAGGEGTTENGVSVCLKCHEWAHMGREGRKWFERYREERLLHAETV